RGFLAAASAPRGTHRAAGIASRQGALRWRAAGHRLALRCSGNRRRNDAGNLVPLGLAERGSCRARRGVLSVASADVRARTLGDAVSAPAGVLRAVSRVRRAHLRLEVSAGARNPACAGGLGRSAGARSTPAEWLRGRTSIRACPARDERLDRVADDPALAADALESLIPAE